MNSRPSSSHRYLANLQTGTLSLAMEEAVSIASDRCTVLGPLKALANLGIIACGEHRTGSRLRTAKRLRVLLTDCSMGILASDLTHWQRVAVKRRTDNHGKLQRQALDIWGVLAIQPKKRQNKNGDNFSCSV